MSRFKKILERMVPYFATFANNRYISSVKDSFIKSFPLIMPASIFILFANLFLNDSFGLPKLLGGDNKVVIILSDASNILINGTTNVFALFIGFMIAISLAEKSKVNPIQTGLVALASFLMMIPKFELLYTSSKGLFTAIVVSIVVSEIFIKLSQNKKLAIKMPDQVPPAVSKSFAALFPATITLTIVALTAAIFKSFDSNLPDLITGTLQAPLLNLAGNSKGLIVMAAVQNLLWTFGIHGAGVLGGIKGMIFAPLMDDNLRAMAAGMDSWHLPHVITQQSYDLYANIGGAGASLTLAIAILIFSKRKDYRKVAMFALIPCIFNIAEPMVFGLPIVMNPIMFIPFILAPTLMTALAAFLTYIGFAPMLGAVIPWVTPVGISTFLASGGHWQASVTSFLCMGLGIVIYIPFVLMANKMEDVEGSGELSEDDDDDLDFDL